MLSVIGDSRSAFEQAHALVIADQIAGRDTLDIRTREQLRDAVTAALATDHVRSSRSRRAIAERILERLSTDAGAHHD